MFSGLVNLQYLDLSFNNISQVDEDAFKYLRSLEHLSLGRNSLTVLGDWTRPLLSLKILDVSQNLLVQLSSSLKLNNVEILNLSDNMLVDIIDDDDVDVGGVVGVTHLDLSYNKLTRVPLGMLTTTLTELNLSGNMIKYLDQSSLQGLSDIKVREHCILNILSKFENEY